MMCGPDRRRFDLLVQTLLPNPVMIIPGRVSGGETVLDHVAAPWHALYTLSVLSRVCRATILHDRPRSVESVPQCLRVTSYQSSQDDSPMLAWQSVRRVPLKKENPLGLCWGEGESMEGPPPFSPGNKRLEQQGEYGEANGPPGNSKTKPTHHGPPPALVACHAFITHATRGEVEHRRPVLHALPATSLTPPSGRYKVWLEESNRAQAWWERGGADAALGSTAHFAHVELQARQAPAAAPMS
ncbi:hypothetical protein GQ53DRAFT_19691 [Thozetella sp. PMI_491]|nr:hypothetical protein GQ53DRAFT_19691 [Thozetella sp. PMI_491]